MKHQNPCLTTGAQELYLRNECRLPWLGHPFKHLSRSL